MNCRHLNVFNRQNANEVIRPRFPEDVAGQ